MPEVFHSATYTLVALLLLVWGGNWLCKLILKISGLTAAMDRRQAAGDGASDASHMAEYEAKVGGLIGAFERLILVAGVLSGSWEVFAGVVALKTVARFKELDERLDAEYFLVGSLFSILWALLIATGWVAYDKSCGLDLSAGITAFVTSFKAN